MRSGEGRPSTEGALGFEAALIRVRGRARGVEAALIRVKIRLWVTARVGARITGYQAALSIVEMTGALTVTMVGALTLTEHPQAMVSDAEMARELSELVRLRLTLTLALTLAMTS